MWSPTLWIGGGLVLVVAVLGFWVKLLRAELEASAVKLRDTEVQLVLTKSQLMTAQFEAAEAVAARRAAEQRIQEQLRQSAKLLEAVRAARLSGAPLSEGEQAECRAVLETYRQLVVP